MAGYLDAYGVADQRRERLVKRIFIWSLSAILIATIVYFTLRTHGQERIVSQFLEDLNISSIRTPTRCGAVPRIANLSSR